MKTGKKILAFLLAVSMMVPMSACGSKVKTPEDIQNAGTLYMATNAEFEPFEYKDGDEVVGIDIEISQKIADKLGVELEVSDIAFDTLITALQRV